MPKKKLKLSEMTQTHAQDESKPQFKTLDQVWGDTGLSRYKTLNRDEYLTQLREMADVDLHSHALAIGLVPNPDREQLKKRLLSEFDRYAVQFSVMEKPVMKKQKISAEVRAILSEGR